MSEREPMTIREILEIALSKEQAAHDFYERMLASAKVDVIRDTLEMLKDEEYKHTKIVERKLADLEAGRI